jgi:hypothetical protein
MGQCNSKDQDFKSMLMQYLDTAAVVCKCEHWDFKREHGTVQVWGPRL